MSTIYAALDLETTGLVPGRHAICEIGVVLFDRDNIIGHFGVDIYVDHNKFEISPEAINVNGFTAMRLNHGRDFILTMYSLDEQFKKIMAELKATRILMFAHNAPFDVGFLKANNFIHLLPTWSDMLRRVVDTVAMGFQFGIGDFGELQSLKKLAEHLLTPDELAAWKPHTALGDAEITARCAMKLMRMQRNLKARLAL